MTLPKDFSQRCQAMHIQPGLEQVAGLVPSLRGIQHDAAMLSHVQA